MTVEAQDHLPIRESGGPINGVYFRDWLSET